MKSNLIIITLFLSTFSNLFANDLTITADCKMSVENRGTVVTYNSVTLSNSGKNSQYFDINFNNDENNGVIISLNETSKVCADTDCKTYKGTTYTLSLTRFENELAAKMQLSKVKSAKGQTANAMEITVFNDKNIEVDLLDEENQVKTLENVMPQSIAINYEVKENVIKKADKIKMECFLK